MVSARRRPMHCDNDRHRQARRVDLVSGKVLVEPLLIRPVPQAHVVRHLCQIVIEMPTQKFSASRRMNSLIPIFSEGDVMSWWNIFGHTAVSDSGKVIQRVSDTTSVSSDGTTYTRMGSTTIGSDGSIFTQTGSSSSDGSTRMGDGATGLGSVFNKRCDGFNSDDW